MAREDIIRGISFWPVSFIRDSRWGSTDTTCEPNDLHPSEYEVSDTQLENISDVVGWYQSGSWEGDGFVIVKSRDGLFAFMCMSHCSCYGPWDGYQEPRWTWDEMITEARKNPEWFEQELPVYQYAARLFGRELGEESETESEVSPADRTISRISDSV